MKTKKISPKNKKRNSTRKVKFFLKKILKTNLTFKFTTFTKIWIKELQLW